MEESEQRTFDSLRNAYNRLESEHLKALWRIDVLEEMIEHLQTLNNNYQRLLKGKDYDDQRS